MENYNSKNTDQVVKHNPSSTEDIKNRPLLTGMFSDRESTEKAYNDLHSRGYSKDDIHLVMSDETRKNHYSDDMEDTELGSKAAEGLGVGSAIGGTVGAIAGAILAIGTSLAIPGLGIVVAGPIAAALAGAGAGGLTGGLVGGLIGTGIPEERAKLYDSGIKKGNVFMGVHAKNHEEAQDLQKSWKNNKGEEVHY